MFVRRVSLLFLALRTQEPRELPTLVSLDTAEADPGFFDNKVHLVHFSAHGGSTDAVRDVLAGHG